MSRSLHKSINSIKPKVEKCDEVHYLLHYLLFNGQKCLPFNGVNVNYWRNLL